MSSMRFALFAAVAATFVAKGAIAQTQPEPGAPAGADAPPPPPPDVPSRLLLLTPGAARRDTDGRGE